MTRQYGILTGTATGRLAAAAAIAAGFLAAAKSPAADAGLGEAFTYDVDTFRKTDAGLRRYDEAAAIRPGLPKLSGVSVGNGDTIFVVGGPALRALDPNGTVRWTAALDAPARCVAAADGALYVSFQDHVEVFGADGEQQNVWTSLGERALVTSIAVAGTNVFVADAGTRVLWRFDREGGLRGQVGEPGAEAGRGTFLIPSPHFDVAAAPDGTVWVTNPGHTRVEHRAPDGRMLGSWGRAGMAIDAFCGCCNPTDIALLPGGALVTSEKGLPRVKRYRADGSFEGVVAGPEDFDAETVGLDLAADAAGRVLVVDPARRLLRVFVRRAAAPPAPAAPEGASHEQP